MALATFTAVLPELVSVTESDTGLRLSAPAPFVEAFVASVRPTSSRETLNCSSASSLPTWSQYVFASSGELDSLSTSTAASNQYVPGCQDAMTRSEGVNHGVCRVWDESTAHPWPPRWSALSSMVSVFIFESLTVLPSSLV